MLTSAFYSKNPKTIYKAFNNGTNKMILKYEINNKIQQNSK